MKRHVVGSGPRKGIGGKLDKSIKWALEKEFGTVVLAVAGGVVWSYLEWKGYAEITKRLDGIDRKLGAKL
jgi:hypothetical protein